MTLSTMVAAATLLLVFARPLHADSKTEDAKALFEQASGAFALGKFADAAQLYERAFELKPDSALLFNAAQAHRFAGNRTRALFLYRNYVRVYGLRGAPAVDDAREQILRLEKSIEDEQAAAAAAAPPKPVEPTTARTPTAAAPTLTATPVEPRPARAPLYKKWWLWTIVGGVAAGGAVGLAVGLTQPHATFSAPLGTVGPAALGVR